MFAILILFRVHFEFQSMNYNHNNHNTAIDFDKLLNNKDHKNQIIFQ